MSVLHSTLTGSDNHEVKGADTATAGQVLSADGAGHGVFVAPSSLVNLEVVSTLSNSSSVSILPGAVDTNIAASFDSTVSNSDINMDAGGTVTILTAGTYHMTFNLNFGRTGSSGTAIIASRMLLNGTQFGFTQAASLALAAVTHPAQFNIIMHLNANDTVRVQVMRDSSGVNDGGLIAIPITPAGWNDGMSYWARFSRLKGAL